MNLSRFSFLFLLLAFTGSAPAQYRPDDSRLDQVPQHIIERIGRPVPGLSSTVVTIDGWDNFSLGVDFGENNMAEHPGIPAWYFTAYNINNPYHTENGIDWLTGADGFGEPMRGDPVAACDSLGNLFYINMYGSPVAGARVIASSTNGITWNSPVVAVSGNDKCWIACDQTSGPFANYVYATMSDGAASGNFSRSADHGATFSITFSPSTQELPGMMSCVGPQGDIQGGAVYLVANGGEAFSSVYTFYRSSDGGMTFSQRSSQQWANTVGAQVEGRHSVDNMRTRPYPWIAADNSYGTYRGKLYCVYASNDPPGDGHMSDIFCRSSADGGLTWSNAVKVNDDPGTENSQQWHPSIWCDKETGRLYVMWMDARDTPTNDSACIYASYSVDGGATFLPNQRISNEKMKIDCETCGGGGMPRYQGDYNGVVSNKKVALLGWTDFRDGTFRSMTGYFPDFAMAVDKSADTLVTPDDAKTIMVSVPAVKLYADTVLISALITPIPSDGSITFEYPFGSTMTLFPQTLPVVLRLNGNVPGGDYLATFTAAGPNGTPVHRRTAVIKVLPEAVAAADPDTICLGQSSQLSCTVIGGASPYNYLWSPPGTLNDPSLANPLATPEETTIYRVTVTDNASRVFADSVTVTIDPGPEPPGPITGPQLVCAGSLESYAIVDPVEGVNYSWICPLHATIVSGQNTPQVTIRWSGYSGTLQVVAGDECGINPIPSVLFVTVNLPPYEPGPVAGPDTVCAGAQAIFSVVPAVVSDYLNWMVPPDATILEGQGADSIRVQWGASDGMISVFAENNCGKSDTVSGMVSVAMPPGAAGEITGKDTVCLDRGNYIYSTSLIPDADGYSWRIPEGMAITAGEGTNSITLFISDTAHTGTIAVQGANECGPGEESTKLLYMQQCAGASENGRETSLRLYPNPGSGEMTLVAMCDEKNMDLIISDLAGKIFYSEKLLNTPRDFIRKVDISGFKKGIYLLKLSGSESIRIAKMVVH